MMFSHLKFLFLKNQNNNKYLVNVIKTKVDFNCLIATDSANTEYTASIKKTHFN